MRLLTLVLIAVFTVMAQSGLQYQQLRDMLRSSVNQGMNDREIAKYLKIQKLGFALTEGIIEDFLSLGIGPKTINALRKMTVESAGLPPADLTPRAASKPNQPPPPSKQEQERIIAEARRNALEYTDELPDFVCLQITRRYVDPSGLEMDWLKYDEVKTRVGYVSGQEQYEVVSVNNRLTSKGIQDLGGATSTGEFGSMMAELFAPKTNAVFTWARHSLLRARPVYVFIYRVPQPRSRWRLVIPKGPQIVTGYTGLIYIDKETERVLRIVAEAEDIPPSFPMQMASTRLDYDFVDLSGREFLLPLKARVRMRADRQLTRNDVEFRLYRKFEAEAVISFGDIDDIEPLPEEPERP